MPIQGKLELTLKITQLPSETTTDKRGWTVFIVDCGGRPVTIALRPRMWTKLVDANIIWPNQWYAAISGEMGRSIGKGFELAGAIVQVFEQKKKGQQPIVDVYDDDD